MRTRVAVLLTACLAVVMAVVVIALAQADAARRSQQLALDRAADTARFADLSLLGFQTGFWTAAAQEMARFEDLYGVRVAVVDLEGVPQATSPQLDGELPDNVRAEVRAALAGAPQRRLDPVYPWRRDDYVAAQPVGADSQTLGAAVTVSPTGGLARDSALRAGFLMLGGSGALLAVVGLVAAPLGAWVLRPVSRLERAAHRVASGDLDHPLGPGSGAPELRSLQASFDTMTRSVRSLLARQEQFVVDASHELGNPLTALRLQLEVLATSPGFDERGRGRGRAALVELDRVSSIVADLLALARAGAPTGSSVRTDAAAEVHAAAERWTARGLAVGVSVAAANGPSVVLTAPAHALERVLDALLVNAAIHAPGVPVRLRTTVGGGEVLVEVTDTGPGLAPDELALARTRFWRSKAALGRPGSGLGLAIVEQLVASAGGRIELTGAEPSGLVVRTWWPAAP